MLFHAVHTQAGGNTRKGKGEGEVGREIRNVEGERGRGRKAKVEKEREKVEGREKEERRRGKGSCEEGKRNGIGKGEN